jgi:hypothetical protein
LRYLTVILLIFLLPSCTFLSNRDYVQKKYVAFRGIHRIAVFLQRWPVYLQKPDHNNLGEDFIKTSTYFWAPWKPAVQVNPRAVGVRDIDDGTIRDLLVKVLKNKGLEVSPVEVEPLGAQSLTVAAAMAQYQAINPAVDAFLFVYYSPVLYVSHHQATPKDHLKRSYGLQEFIQMLEPGNDSVIWVGKRSAQSPSNSISHAFIYISMTLFKAQDWQMLLEVADSQTGGKVHPWIPECPPGPTDLDYPADARVIQNLMVNNLDCRLRHLIPDVF